MKHFILTASSVALISSATFAQELNINLSSSSSDSKSSTIQTPDHTTSSSDHSSGSISHRSPLAYAPIGVMGSHTHKKGGWMLSYRFMTMSMDENFLGSSSISDTEALAEGFMVTPTDMTMNMHMVGLMYAATDKLTLMGMIGYSELSMNHVTAMGQTFETESSGLTDATISALYNIYEKKAQRVHIGLGLQLPTGAFEEEDFIPGPGVTYLPYPMQPGSGTFAIKPSITWNKYFSNQALGAQAMGTIYLNENDQGWRPGNKAEASVWAAQQINRWSSVSLRLRGQMWNDIEGSAEDLLPLPVPTARTDLRGGTKISAALGVNLIEPKSGFRVGIEFNQPLYQDLDGPQLAEAWSLTIGSEYSW